jgi:hypothetical protein
MQRNNTFFKHTICNTFFSWRPLRAAHLAVAQPMSAQVLRLLGLPENDMALLTRDAAAARIHVSFMGKLLTPDALTERKRAGKWTHVVAFRPTGARMHTLSPPVCIRVRQAMAKTPSCR